ncbi:MAG: DnaD domain protein [Defluviitaleaceae bacterium]|nr:DnaD domain protein [Defluviitaleaceae bacterium]
MNTCPPVYALIYLYSLRRLAEGEAITLQALAAHFNVLESDVHNAWRHWEEVGIISIEGSAPDMSILFLPPEQWGKGNAHSPPPPQKALANERPQYAVEELTLFKERSKEVEQLFTRAEQALGKLLTYHDMNLLFGFYDWLRLPVDVLDLLLTYCAENDHRDLRYIEKCALDWADRGINTVEKAREYIQTFDGVYRAVLQAMGQTGCIATPTQKKYIEKWRKDWAMPLTLIMEACDRAGVQIGKPKFTYVDKIIASWHKAGITTMDGVHAADAEFSKSKEDMKTPARIVKPKSTRFANFTQRKNDNASFERMEREAYILKELQG